MKLRYLIASLVGLLVAGHAFATLNPIANPNLTFVEVDGLVAAEAEHFVKQELTDVRAWHIISTVNAPDIEPDADPANAADASGGAYLEILPDNRRTHDEKLIRGENFSPEPGKMAILTYRVYFSTPGRYYFWGRIYSTGPEDNGMHIGINGSWPESGQRWQTVKKRAWQWDCKQRTDAVHVGVPMQLYIDVDTVGSQTIQISMREDGFQLDKWVMSRDINYVPTGMGPKSVSRNVEPPPPFPATAQLNSDGFAIEAKDLSFDGTDFYLDQDKWGAINPDKAKTATVETTVPVGNARYHVTLYAVGENDGRSTYEISIGGRSLGEWQVPDSTEMFEEGPDFNHTWQAVTINEGEKISLRAVVGTDGQEFARARWSKIVISPFDRDLGKIDVAAVAQKKSPEMKRTVTHGDRQPDGDASVSVHGDLMQWHRVTLDVAGPFAHELDLRPNAFTDYELNVTFTHSSGAPSYTVPGYFAADGNAGESGADSGTVWRAHLSPDKAGAWTYEVAFLRGPNAATYNGGTPLSPYHGLKGSFQIAKTDKKFPDFRARGRLTYDGTRYLKFAGDGTTFLKAGADAPETWLAYADFDNTIALKPNVPLKTWGPHIGDWRDGDPTWHGHKGKGIIGSLNYLGGKGANAFSFLTYNAGGDGNNIWPFVDRDDKFHYDVSKLDQWEIVFAHAQKRGVYLHFKLQENELDDHRAGAQRNHKIIPEAFDAGETGPERRLYFREIIARFGHHLALNWNFGEENTQSYEEQIAMFNYVDKVDAYDHNRVIHTFPSQQDAIYTTLLGDKSNLTGTSAQNHWRDAHRRTLQWIEASGAAGRQWVVANDEQNPANMGVPPDPGYQGFDGYATDGDGKSKYNLHHIRKYTLWGNLMAGGAGVEYYFGYKMLQNDLTAEDLRSRDRTWDYCRIALKFFLDLNVDLNSLHCDDTLVGTEQGANGNWCLADPGSLYVVYLPEGGEAKIDLSGDNATYDLTWFNPRNGTTGSGTKASVKGGKQVSLGKPKQDTAEDWAIILKKR